MSRLIRRNTFTTFLAAVLGVGCTCSHAASIDGFWSCQIANTNSYIIQNYIAISSHPDGNALFAVLTESNNSNYFGYGVGTLVGSTFAGNTKFATPFSLTLGSDGILTGSAQGIVNGQTSNFTVKCVRVW